MSDNYNKNRILKNSLLLYVRMLFTMWLNLWTTRLVLANLGIEDMGVYGVVGSIVGLVTVFTGGVTNAIQRFITFEAGKSEGKINLVFCTSLNVIFLLAVLVLVVLEGGGIYMLYHSVKIPATSMNAALWVLQLSILTCIIDLISVPYNALIIAHEKMDAFAVISFLQVVLNFAAACGLSLFQDRLLVYAVMTAAVSIFVRLVYQAYCHSCFAEARYHFLIDRQMLRQMGKFAGISTVSGILEVIVAQGIVLIINWTFGVALNAVYNIALQLKNSILSFALNLFKAISPQITKTYANGEIETHKKLVYSGSKLEAYLIYFIMIPFLFRAEYIMHLWLGEIPKYATEFAMCTVFISFTYAIFEPIHASVLATNRITSFKIIPNTFYLLVLPLGYLIGRYTQLPVLLIAFIVTMDMLTCAFRTYYAVKVSPLRLHEILVKITIPVLLVAGADCIVCYILSLFTAQTIFGMIVLLAANSLALCTIIIFLGLNYNERSLCFATMHKLLDLYLRKS